VEREQAILALAALAQSTRLEAFRLLAEHEPEGLPAGEVARRLAVPHNTMSTHLAVLARAGLVAPERQSRVINYRACLDGFRELTAYLINDCCGGRSEVCAPLIGKLAPSARQRRRSSMNEHAYNVLFLCTGNSARSILAESILNRYGQGRFKAYSAGSHPKGKVHPYAIDLLRNLHYNTEGLRSKSWDEFAAPGAPVMDFVFTVCDDAANETCPIWPGQPMTAHWGVSDPAAAEGTEAVKRAAFADACRMLTNRISIFTSLPLTSLDGLALQKRLDEIGQQRNKAPAKERA
jgi:ArsR family transcriptional regulator, arsenate/arsenite/antimonite-responsive transcriptional repressor / arsenate reductase (thioredoxin)